MRRRRVRDLMLGDAFQAAEWYAPTALSCSLTQLRSVALALRTSRCRSAVARPATRHRAASREYLGILELAAKEGEAKVETVLDSLLNLGEEEMSAKAVEARLAQPAGLIFREVQVAPVNLQEFDQLCVGAEVCA